MAACCFFPMASLLLQMSVLLASACPYAILIGTIVGGSTVTMLLTASPLASATWVRASSTRLTVLGHLDSSDEYIFNESQCVTHLYQNKFSLI